MYFNVKEYGVCADGKTINTKAIQSAINACNEAGGGVVFFEAGVYLTGSLEIKSNVELHLTPGCKIVGSTNINEYEDLISEGFKHEFAPEGTATYLIGAKHATNIAITGAGEINASGLAFYDTTELRADGKFAKKPKQRPRLLMFHACTDVKLTEVSLVDSPCWTCWLMQCERVHIHRIKVIGDWKMRNNDGIDIDACKDVTVSDCFIKVDDDSLVVRAMQVMYDTPAICENIVVTNCTLESTCQCVRISCPSDYIVRNCVFSNLLIKSTQNGINFDLSKGYLVEEIGGLADISNISFSNIIIDCEWYPIRIEVDEGIKLSRVAGISFSDIRIKSDHPCVIKGSSDTIIEDVVFNNIKIKTSGSEAIICSNCRGVKLNNVELSSCNERGIESDKDV